MPFTRVATCFLALLFWTPCLTGLAEEPSAKCVVLITLDGLRCEEVFGGADERLMIPELGVDSPEKLKAKYAGESPEQRRRRLLPFLWKTIDEQGWIAGDFSNDSQVTVTNGRYFSYPGYNEILTGSADPKINSNAKKYNRNTTVLEWLNNQTEFKDQVAAFCSWDVFPFIINDKRSGIPVNAGWMNLTVGDDQTVQALNFAAENLFHEWDGVRYDAFTSGGAIQYLRERRPRVLYVALGETDDWAHAGRYDRYLLAAQQNDHFIELLWNEIESNEFYAGQTAFVITTDHGRGDGREGWKSHSVLLAGSERIWISAFGAGIDVRGLDKGGRFEQAQVAATVAKILGHDFEVDGQSVAPPLSILKSRVK